ncbi:uncharacterized protein VTP21DRAFT_1048 [Calcarisporiella thermophila]|uniref:uncharacterized protein n=1 Tax=Calcarisporiella thermophila TaxID=911321 RepID=UPI0037429188
MASQPQPQPTQAPPAQSSRPTFTSQQLFHLKLQIMVFKLLSQKQAVPSNLLEAALGGATLERSVGADIVESVYDHITQHGMVKQWSTVFAEGHKVEEQRLLVPSAGPSEIDSVVLVQEQERRSEQKIEKRLKELEEKNGLDMEMDMELDEDGWMDEEQLAKALELKGLKMLGQQRKLREEILRGLNKVTTLAASVDRAAYRRMKKQSLRDARLAEKLERQQRQDREKREKQRHMSRLTRILQHGREMQTVHRAHQARLGKLGRAVLNYHAHVEKEEDKRNRRTQEERLRALRNDDEEAYLKLIDRTKDTRINQLLEQTDQYLFSLSQAVIAQQNDKMHLEKSGDTDELMPDESSIALEEETEGEKKLDYYTIAHRISEPIKSQPSMLVGGTLKEYQLKGLQWMVSLYNNRLNGILADEMGLGKTIQTISLITHLLEKKQNGPFLIIVPLS